MKESDFRRKLVEFTAFSGPWARRVAEHGLEAGLATKLGVRADVLEDAAKLIRSGFLPKKGPRLVELDLFVPHPIAEPLKATAEDMMMSGAQLVRSILHSAMQTRLEPSPRAPRQWNTRKGAKAVGIGFRGRSLRESSHTERVHVGVQVSRGLAEALDRRSAAFGATRARYCLLWSADYVDGLLGALRVVPVARAQLFDDARAYVLPAVAVPEESAVD